MAASARHIEVELTLLPTERSGRRAPIYSGFPSAIQIDERAWDAMPELQQLEFIFPGESARAFISFRNPASQSGKLSPGKSFRLLEGCRVIGEGRVTRVLDLGAA
jgi:translation elongation factor EF-Tu-like GTPase